MTQKTFYPTVDSSPDFAKLEEQTLQFWKEKNLFQQSVDERPKGNAFTFYDGPPFANGLPHYGHLLTGFVKDLVARYQTQKGKRVERRFGWDCHGLPAEMGAEKELGISGRISIMEHGIDKFNEQCRTSVMKYTSEWEYYVNRQGRWVDFENDYKTMDITYMESVMWAFKQLFDKGLVYQSMRVMPYSWACETPLSNFETRLDNSYRERADKAVTVAFTLKDKPASAPAGCDAYKILAWTTTPWTLPSNLALGIGKDIEYSAVIKDNTCYIIATSSVAKYSKELGEQEPVAAFKGAELVGLTYEPLLPYFKNHPNSFRIFHGDFVMEGDGTGIVHLAPGFGEDDQKVCEENGIELVCPVDNAGKFDALVPDYEGIQVLDTNDEIIKRLKTDGSWIKTEQYLHNYPHCWRTDTPLIYKAVPSWYVEVTKFKDRMVELNQQINWIPGHIKDGLFGKWLENARDWSISRNRFWGAPLPVWKSDNPHNDTLYVFGSIAELEAFFGQKVTDLHRPYVDELTKPDPENPKYTIRRVEDVFDCWFESGSMPYAQVHYPFENKEWFETHFPADFIVEYTAQTRGWFYTLMVLGTALFDKPPFLNCICHGVVLDEKGQKLSKRLNNYADPRELFKTYGADALRWLMVSSPVMRGGELLIDKEGKMVRDVLRLAIKPIWNAYNFFTLYANADGIEAKLIQSSDNLMDNYILAKTREAVSKIESSMDAYDTPGATAAVEAFFEVLNNWYIRRSRPRFWKETQDADKQAAYDTLYTALHTLCRAAAPLLPFVTESIWQGLVHDGSSVHLSSFPDANLLPANPELAQKMDRVRDVCNAALAIRNNQNLRVRQPLATLSVIGKNIEQIRAYSDVIADEVNVKEVTFSSDIGDAASFRLQVNFPVLGKRLPAKMKDIIAASKQGKWEDKGNGVIEIAGEQLQAGEFSILLDAKDPAATQPLSTNDALVILDLNVTDALKAEGLARDLIRMIQQSRKDADLNISDRIALMVETPSSDISAAVLSFKDYIAEQTLAISVTAGTASNSNHRFEQTLEGESVVIGFNVAA